MPDLKIFREQSGPVIEDERHHTWSTPHGHHSVQLSVFIVVTGKHGLL